MTADQILLLCLLLLPLAGAIVVDALGPRHRNPIRWISFATAVATLVLAAILTVRFSTLTRSQPAKPLPGGAGLSLPTFEPVFVPGSPGHRKGAVGLPAEDNAHETSWDMLHLGPGVVQFYIGLDGLNVWMVMLTAVLMLPSVLVSWVHVTERVNEFYAWLLALQTVMMGIFLSFDIILFYVFFELSLVPLFFLIGIWGGPQRRYAARKFLIYTLTGSLLTLLGVLGIVLAVYHKSSSPTADGIMTFSIPRLVELVHQLIQDPTEQAYWANVQVWVFLALTAGFAVKVPLVPLHTWLPLAHVEAPTAGSVDLAGVLLKVGAYGFLRLAVPLAPDASLALGLPAVTIMATVGVVYGALVAFAQDDVKRLVAYSSVSHLGLCMLGMFTLNVIGITGALLLMINHGLSTGALFLLIGIIYDRYHTRRIGDYGGMARVLPLFGCFMVFISLTSIGLPGLNGFVSEALCLFGIFGHEWANGRWPVRGVLASLTVVLGAWYMLTMVQRVLFGPVKEPGHGGHGRVTDLDLREVTILAPLAALCLLLGVYPQPVLNTIEPDVLVIADIADRARARAEAGLAVTNKDQRRAEAREKNH
jgi:NADH-quinone oxidoreductase subunit M